MPKTLQYKTGSVIYFQGEEADKVFILQTGMVSIAYDDLEMGESVWDRLQPGEFFGVKSALGRFPREETALAVTDSVVAVFTVSEFELFAMSNTKIILKMLKVFSNQMRHIHNKVSSLIEGEVIKPDEGLFGIGEKYMRDQRYSHAKYIFNRYLTYYPDGKDAEKAVKHLQIAEIALAQSTSGETEAAL